MEINSNHSTYGAAFRQKPIFFMSGKETVAFFEGKLKKNMTLQEDSCTLGSNDTYRRQHTTYEVSDKKKGSTFLDLDFLIKDETSSLKGNLSDKKDVDFYNFSIPFNRTMYQYYTGIADSVGNLTSNTWQYATDVQEVRRYLKGVTGEDISLENLYLTPDGKIGGLPEKAANLINKTKDNAKIERIKDALINIIGHNRTSGDLGIPDFTSEFQFSNGAFSVADSGFTVDMAALDRRLTPQPHDNMYSDMYAYSFRKVL